MACICDHSEITSSVTAKAVSGGMAVLMDLIFSPSDGTFEELTKRQKEIYLKIKEYPTNPAFFCEKYRISRAELNNDIMRLTYMFPISETDDGSLYELMDFEVGG